MTSEGMDGIGGIVFWQAHRGGGGVERPDNTLASAVYGWDLGGAAEMDIRLTADGKIICLHDPTLRRTTDAPDGIADIPVTSLAWDQIANLDAGAKFGAEFAGAKIPLLTEIFSAMAADSRRRTYLDCKNIDFGHLAGLIARYGLDGRIWVTGPRRADLVEIKTMLPSVDTMQWLGGSAAEIQAKFEDSASAGFHGLGQIQLHLNAVSLGKGWKYSIDTEFVRMAAAAARAAGVDFQVYPKTFESRGLARLLEMGISWYVTDEPARFLETMTELQATTPKAGT